jgi:hypothetical protein
MRPPASCSQRPPAARTTEFGKPEVRSESPLPRTLVPDRKHPGSSARADEEARSGAAPTGHPRDTHGPQKIELNGKRPAQLVRRQGLEPRTRGLRGRSGACRLVSFPQVSVGGWCRRVSADVDCLRRHRAPMEHRDRRPVLHLRPTRGSGTTPTHSGLTNMGNSVSTSTTRQCPGSSGAGEARQCARRSRPMTPRSQVVAVAKARTENGATLRTCRRPDGLVTPPLRAELGSSDARRMPGRQSPPQE